MFGLGKGYRHQHEFILFDGFIDASITNESDLWKISRDVAYKHPTQKPVALLEYLIKTYTNKNDTVLDFTMGSGSTGVACKNLNRNFIGIELDTDYFNIAKKRIDSISSLDNFIN